MIRRKSRPILDRLSREPPGEVVLSSLVVAELCYGAHKSPQQAQNRAALTNFLTAFVVVDFALSDADEYGRVRTELERSGLPIGALDTLIAAHARNRGLVLVTNNTREFSRVAGLVVEDWSQGP